MSVKIIKEKKQVNEAVSPTMILKIIELVIAAMPIISEVIGNLNQDDPKVKKAKEATDKMTEISDGIDFDKMKTALSAFESKDVKTEATTIGSDYIDSVKVFLKYLVHAYDIINYVEEGVIENIVEDDSIYQRLHDYIFKLRSAVRG